ncbi:hypothetical protein AQ482_06265, partial [Acinetobacter baumannii]
MDDMLEPEDIVGAKIDLENIRQGAGEDMIVTPRSGLQYKSLPMIARELMTDIFTATIKKDNTIYYSLNGSTVIKDTNPAFFAIELSVSEN